MTDPITLTPQIADSWANGDHGPVALTSRQKLLSVEGADAVIFPPTYADIGYNIDRLSDGTKVATIDSVGAQANRMEPLFKAPIDGYAENPLAKLVPQVEITYGNRGPISLLDVGHRLGDVFIRSTELADEVRQAFEIFLDTGNANEIARLAPTSLVFGVWDSRETSAKLPRIVQSVIRAWNIDELKRSAQYNPPVDYGDPEYGAFRKDDVEKAKEEAEKPGTKNALAQRGFVHVPAPSTHGGIVVHGEIRRDVTVNLIALRRLKGENGTALRRYVLGLALVAATAPLDGFLRQGCLIVPDPDTPATWTSVGRDGVREEVALSEKVALDFAQKTAATFGVGANRKVDFDKERAQKDADKAPARAGTKKKT